MLVSMAAYTSFISRSLYFSIDFASGYIWTTLYLQYNFINLNGLNSMKFRNFTAVLSLNL